MVALVGPGGLLSPYKPFDVQVAISGATNLAAFDLDLIYDRSLLEVTGITLGDFLGGTTACDPDSTRCAFALGPQVGDYASSVGGYSYGSGTGANGDGALATLHLEPTGEAGTTVLQLASPLLAGTDASPVTPVVISATLTLIEPQQVYLPLLINGDGSQALATRGRILGVGGQDQMLAQLPSARSQQTPASTPT